MHKALLASFCLCASSLAAEPCSQNFSQNFSLKPIAELDHLGDGGSRVTLFHLSSDAPSSLVERQLIKDGDSFGVIYLFDNCHSTSHYFFLEPFYYAYADQLALELTTCPEPVTTTRFPMQESQASVDLKGFSFTYKKGAGEGRHSSDYGVSLFTPPAFNFHDIKFFDAAGDAVSISPVSCFSGQETTSTLYHLSKSAVASITEAEVTYYPGPYSHVRIPFPEIVPAVKPKSAASSEPPVLSCELLAYQDIKHPYAFLRLGYDDAKLRILKAKTVSDKQSRGVLGDWRLSYFHSNDTIGQYRDPRTGELYVTLTPSDEDAPVSSTLEAEFDVICSPQAATSTPFPLASGKASITVNGEELPYSLKEAPKNDYDGDDIVPVLEPEHALPSFIFSVAESEQTIIRAYRFLDAEKKEIKLSLAQQSMYRYHFTREERAQMKYVEIEFYPTPYETKRVKLSIPLKK